MRLFPLATTFAAAVTTVSAPSSGSVEPQSRSSSALPRAERRHDLSCGSSAALRSRRRNHRRGRRQRPELMLVSRDNEHDPVETVAAYRELMERDVVAMVGATTAIDADDHADGERLAKGPGDLPATDATAITENNAKKEERTITCSAWQYRNRAGKLHGRRHREEVRARENRSSDLDRRLGSPRARSLQRRLKEDGLARVADETSDNDDTDMTPQLIKLKAPRKHINYGLVRENSFVVKTKRSSSTARPPSQPGASLARPFGKPLAIGEGVLTGATVTMDGPQSPDAWRFRGLPEALRRRHGRRRVRGRASMRDTVQDGHGARSSRPANPRRPGEHSGVSGSGKAFHAQFFTATATTR